MPDFDKNAGYIWAIVLIGVIVPLLLAVYAAARARMAKARLERFRQAGFVSELRLGRGDQVSENELVTTIEPQGRK